MSIAEPKHPDVFVELSQMDKNVFMIIGTVQRHLREAGYAKDAVKFASEVTRADGYYQMLAVCASYVNIA